MGAGAEAEVDIMDITINDTIESWRVYTGAKNEVGVGP